MDFCIIKKLVYDPRQIVEEIKKEEELKKDKKFDKFDL